MRSLIHLLGLSLLLSVTRAWSDSPISSTSASYTNSSTSTSALQILTPSAAPTYCGGCALIYQVHASVWWPSIVTEVVATMVYVVDNSTGSTIGSSLKYPSNTTTLGGATNYSQIASASFVEYTTFTALSDIESATIVQENIITFNASHYENGYVVSTLGVNASATGSLVGVTQCLGSYYTPNPLSTNVPPYLPASTAYTYTTVVSFNSTYNMSNVLSLGLDIFASSVATHLHLTVPNCTSGGGGYGTLKIPVLPSTTSETEYAAPQAQVATTTASMVSAPQVTVTTTQPAPPPPPVSSLPAETTTTEPAPPPPVTSVSVFTSTDQPVPPPPPPPSSSLPPSSSTEPAASAESIANPTSSSAPITTTELTYTTTILQTTSGPAGLSTLTSTATLSIPPYILSSYITTIVETISGPSGLETISTIATLPGLSSYTTTILETTSGSSGLETITEVTTLPIGSYIISFLGITGASSAATTTLGSVPSSTSTGGGPTQFTGGAQREKVDKSGWAVMVGLAGFAFEVL